MTSCSMPDRRARPDQLLSRFSVPSTNLGEFIVRLVRSLFFASALAGIFTPQGMAQDNTELLNRMKVMEDRIKALEAEVQTLKGQPGAPVAAAAPVTPQPVAAQPVAAQPVQETAAAASPQLGGAGGAASKA